MNTMEQIRGYMGQQSGPVTAAQVAEALEIDGKRARQALYQAARQEAGVEALEDGTYTLIPGWKPARDAADAGGAAAAPASPRKAGRPKGKAKPAKASKAAKPSKAAKERQTLTTSREPGMATISCESLSVLVQTILAGAAPIAVRLRAALCEATTAAHQA